MYDKLAMLIRIEDLVRDVEQIISNARDSVLRGDEIRIGDLDAMVQDLQFAADLVDALMPEE